MSFNDMNRQLGNAQSKEARIRELSETLLRRGLAMTKESARQLAISMVETEQKVQQRFEQKRQSATNYRSVPNDTIGNLASSYHDAESSSRKRESAEEFRNRALNPTPVSVQVHYDTPHGEITPNMTVAEAVVDRAPIIEPDVVLDTPADDVATDPQMAAEVISKPAPELVVDQIDAPAASLIEEDDSLQEDDAELFEDDLLGDTDSEIQELDDGNAVLIEEDEADLPRVEVYHDDPAVPEDTETTEDIGEELSEIDSIADVIDDQQTMPNGEQKTDVLESELEEYVSEEQESDSQESTQSQNQPTIEQLEDDLSPSDVEFVHEKESVHTESLDLGLQEGFSEYAPQIEQSQTATQESTEQSSAKQSIEQSDLESTSELPADSKDWQSAQPMQEPPQQEPQQPAPIQQQEDVQDQIEQPLESEKEPPKERQDLAKKLGIDLSNIFNVNK